jgi:2-C-methyl-D-erythritol 4-phosphate cytidylyltransferase
MQKTVLIVAGGSGTRMNSSVPKQFLEINRLPILMHTINCFYNYDEHIAIRLVIPQHHIDFWKALCIKYSFNLPLELFIGGITRFHSVKNGLQGISADGLIAIHDGVRPLVDSETINRCFKAAEEYGAAVPVVDVHETIRKINGDYSTTVDRTHYRLVQTPQVFDAQVLTDAYKQSFDESFTDDASVVESTGKLVMLVDGNRENIKITTPADLLIAEALMRYRS